jgi:hypothetical protein
MQGTYCFDMKEAFTFKVNKKPDGAACLIYRRPRRPPPQVSIIITIIITTTTHTHTIIIIIITMPLFQRPPAANR